MHKLMEYICEQLEELERKADKDGKLSMAEIEYVDKLAHIKKSLLSAEEMWEDSEYSEAGGSSYRRGGRSYAGGGSGQSRRGGSSRRGSSYEGGSSYEDGSSYEGGSSYEDGSSYARGRGRNARRDTMGRYSRGGSYENYRMAEDDFKMELKELMQDAPNEQIKQKLQRMMSEM